MGVPLRGFRSLTQRPSTKSSTSLSLNHLPPRPWPDPGSRCWPTSLGWSGPRLGLDHPRLRGPQAYPRQSSQKKNLPPCLPTHLETPPFSHIPPHYGTISTTHFKLLACFCIRNTSLCGLSLMVRRSSAGPDIFLRSIRPVPGAPLAFRPLDAVTKTKDLEKFPLV